MKKTAENYGHKDDVPSYAFYDIDINAGEVVGNIYENIIGDKGVVKRRV